MIAGQDKPAGERFGRYRLLESIGRGGMAEVFRAVAHGVEGFQRVFVIKRILKEKSQSKDFIEMFVSEARLSALLNHPNIVQSYDFGQIAGSYFISMEYLRGKDLLLLMRQLRAAGKTLDPTVAAYIAQQVATGLHYAHSLTGSLGKPLNIVHRDVSPSNIMLLRTGGVKLLDFGIAKFGDSKPAEPESKSPDAFIKGKLSYLSPEQIRGDSIDARADVFSLGVCLWEMLTGRRLFFDKNEYNIMKNVLDRPVIPPSMQRADVPTALDYVVVRALERDVTRRYRSAKEMADELEGFLAASQFSPSSLPRMLDDVFGEDAGIFDAQMEEKSSLRSSWGELRAVEGSSVSSLSADPLARMPGPALASDDERPPGAGRRRGRRALLWVVSGALGMSAVAFASTQLLARKRAEVAPAASVAPVPENRIVPSVPAAPVVNAGPPIVNAAPAPAPAAAPAPQPPDLPHTAETGVRGASTKAQVVRPGNAKTRATAPSPAAAPKQAPSPNPEPAAPQRAEASPAVEPEAPRVDEIEPLLPETQPKPATSTP